MRRRHLTAAAVLGLVILAAACSPAAPPPTAPPTEAAPTEIAAQPTTAPTEAPPTEAPAEAAADLPGLPSEPAAPDAYRADPGALVGATGSPQLVEFFTYW